MQLKKVMHRQKTKLKSLPNKHLSVYLFEKGRIGALFYFLKFGPQS
jgi:hypothetical protein